MTLAERRDFGMVQRIQRFTTQRIPAATIEGLEPKRPPMEVNKPAYGAHKAFGAPRGNGGPGGFGGKPAFGKPGFAKTAARGFAPRPDGGAPFKPAGKKFAKPEGGFAGGPRAPRGPRSEF